MLDAPLLDLLTDTVTIEPWQAQSATGTATYGPAVTYAARVQVMDEIRRVQSGRELLGRGKVYIAMTTVPSPQDRLTLPASYVPRQPPILDVQPESDDAGDTHHVVLVIG